MSRFCYRCGTELGFFSKKKTKKPDGSVVIVCKSCLQKGIEEQTDPSPQPVAEQTSASNPAASTPPAPSPTASSGDETASLAQTSSSNTPDETTLKLEDFLIKSFEKDTGISIRDDDMVRTRIREQAQKLAPRILSGESVEVNLPFLSADASGPKHLQKTVTLKDL